jgi:hypothetical protein
VSRRTWLAGVALVLVALLLPMGMALLSSTEAASAPVAAVSLDRCERPVGIAATLALLAPGCDPVPLPIGGSISDPGFSEPAPASGAPVPHPPLRI